MSWTQDFNDVMGQAGVLSDIADFQKLVKLADEVGSHLAAEKVSSRQIRVLLSETTAGVNRIRQGRTLGIGHINGNREEQRAQMDKAAQREAALLNISLIYNTARDKNGEGAIRQLTALMEQMTKKVTDFEDYRVLRKFSEAIIAYFKFHGGK